MKTFHVYIMTNAARGTLYVGVTNAIARRVDEHKSKRSPGFTRRYNLSMLVYAETADDALSAIAREKQIKGLSRSKKIALIEAENPGRADLAHDWFAGDAHGDVRPKQRIPAQPHERDSSLRSD
ncbi:MAG: GIY-YIG nuclease family protein [Dehalococcoidia bacterium]